MLQGLNPAVFTSTVDPSTAAWEETAGSSERFQRSHD
jgi:hypothetical protein